MTQRTLKDIAERRAILMLKADVARQREATPTPEHCLPLKNQQQERRANPTALEQQIMRALDMLKWKYGFVDLYNLNGELYMVDFSVWPDDEADCGFFIKLPASRDNAILYGPRFNKTQFDLFLRTIAVFSSIGFYRDTEYTVGEIIDQVLGMRDHIHRSIWGAIDDIRSHEQDAEFMAWASHWIARKEGIARQEIRARQEARAKLEACKLV